MTFGDFKSMVAAYMNRETSVFTVNGVDLLARAVNQAKRWAEKQHDFEAARMSAKLPNFSVTTGGKISSVVSNDEPGKIVAVKTIERAFLPFSDGSGTFPIEVVSRAVHQNRVRRKYEDYIISNPKTLPTLTVNYWQLVRWSDLLYLVPADVNGLGTELFDLGLDIVRWLPEYSASTDEDFLLTYCEEFMLFRSVLQLNFLVKEDQRVPISTKAVQDAWEGVLRWDNGQISGTNDDATMD